MTSATADLVLRYPGVHDAPKLHQQVIDSGVLDVNSRYLYLMTVRNFGSTCVVALEDNELVGFITAYRVPDRPETLFVWQVSVAEKFRGRRIASKMLDWLLDNVEGIEFVETTVTPSNDASRRMFHSFGRRRGARVTETPCFSEEDLGEGHEPEELFRIGPFPNND